MQELLDDLSQPYISGLTLSGGHPLEYQNIKIKNDFKDFEKLEQTTGETSLKLILKDVKKLNHHFGWVRLILMLPY